MQHTIRHTIHLPEDKQISIEYSRSVYSPKFSTRDPIVIAHRLMKFKKEPGTLLDVGCGSGVLGLSLKYLFPDWSVSLCDTSPDALKVTRKNADNLKLDVGIFKNDLLFGLGFFDLIVSNLPTYDEEQMELVADKTLELHGPSKAYYGGSDGLKLYRKLFKQAEKRCRILVVECQEKHQDRLLKMAEDRGWVLVIKSEYGFAFTR